MNTLCRITVSHIHLCFYVRMLAVQQTKLHESHRLPVLYMDVREHVCMRVYSVLSFQPTWVLWPMKRVEKLLLVF